MEKVDYGDNKTQLPCFAFSSLCPPDFKNERIGGEISGKEMSLK